MRDGSSSEGKTSREHQIWVDPKSEIVVVAGGKYTTYRIIAKKAVDICVSYRSLSVQARLKSWPKNEPINPQATEDKLSSARIWSHRLAAEFSLPSYLITRLIETYAQEVETLLYQYCESSLEIPAEQRVICAQARFAIHHMQCMNVTDFFVRRSTMFLGDKNHGLNFLTAVSEVFKQELSLSDDERNHQEQVYKLKVQQMLTQF